MICLTYSLFISIFIRFVAGGIADVDGKKLCMVDDTKSALSNQFDWNLYQTICATENGKNVVMSTVGIKLLLGMMYLGATDHVANKLEQILSVKKSEAKQKISTVLESIKAVPNDYYKLLMGMRLLFDKSIKIKQNFIDDLKNNFNIAVGQTNFEETEDTIQDINDWADGITHGSIQRPFDEQAGSGDSGVILANAIYFEGTWVKWFKLQQGSFTRVNGEIVHTQFMEAVNIFSYAKLPELNNCKVIRIPYMMQKYAMYIFLPNVVTDLELVTNDLSPKRFQEIQSKMRPENTLVKIPKFRLEFVVSVTSALDKLRLQQMFLESRYLTNIGSNSDGKLKVSNVVQQVAFDINERGDPYYKNSKSGLAASTKKPVTAEFKAEHGFLFTVVDDIECAMIFIGQFVDPFADMNFNKTQRVKPTTEVLDSEFAPDESSEILETTTSSSLIAEMRKKIIKDAAPINNSTSGDCKLPEKSGRICSMNRNTANGGLVGLSCKCEEGFALVTELQEVYCIGGRWFPKTPECIRVCEPLKLTTLNLDSCKYEKNIVSCSTAAKAGTTVTIKCKENYIPDHPSLTVRSVTCLPNGTWDNVPHTCKPDCGLGSASVRTLSVGSRPAVPDSVPWQAAIYKKSNVNRNKYDFICGGTILSPTLIISAAHCFYDKYSEGPFKATEFKVAVGKYTIAYGKLDTSHTKIIQVKEVHIPETYLGEDSSYVSDIAILELENLIDISSKVMPICVDWSLEDSTPPSTGKVAGWGYTETGNVSEVLRIAELPYIGPSECRSTVQNEWFRRAVSQLDKFCAGTKSGAGVREGDSGGGWIYKVDGRYHIYGVVSFKENDESSGTSIAAFTKIASYLDWIERIKKQVES